MNTLNLVNEILGTSFENADGAQKVLIQPKFLTTIRSGEMLLQKLSKGLNVPLVDTKLLQKEVEFFGTIASTFNLDKLKWEFLQHPTKFDVLEDIFTYMDSLQFRVLTRAYKDSIESATRLNHKLLTQQSKALSNYETYINKYVLTDYCKELLEIKYSKYDSIGKKQVIKLCCNEHEVDTHLGKMNELGLITALAFLENIHNLTYFTDKQEEYIKGLLNTDYKNKLIALYSELTLDTLTHSKCIELVRKTKYAYFTLFKRKYNEELVLYDNTGIEYKVNKLDTKLLANLYVILRWALENKDMFIVSRITTLLTQRNNLFRKL